MEAIRYPSIFFFFTYCGRKLSKEKSSSTLTRIKILPKVSYTELLEATSGLSFENLIGSTSFGYVYKRILDEEEKVVVVKVLKFHSCEDP